MSKTEDTTKEAAAEAAEAPPSSSKGHKEANGSGGLVILFFFIGLGASLVLGWVIFPALLYSKKSQPIDFNHVLHMKLKGISCESCHFFREDGTYSGVPKLAQCVRCHKEVQGETAHEAIFVEKYVSTGREVPWLVYSRQPDCVFFSHAAHVKLAKMDCVTCHGHIGESTSLKAYQENRLTGYSRDIWGENLENWLALKRNPWDRMKMDDCAECHMEETGRKTSISTEKDGCFVCHK